MKEMIKELIAYRHLLIMLIWRDIKIKYKQSVLGFLWAIFMPMMVVAAGILVKKIFSVLSGQPMDLAQLASVSVKALPWAFFVTSVRFATNTLTNNLNLVTKIYFPREVFPLSAVLASLFDLIVASSLLIVILIIAGTGFSIHLLWLPLLLTLLIMLTAGVGMFLACANLFFRDVKYIVEVLLTFGIFFTPVFYEAKMFGKWGFLLLLNPVGAILESINAVVVLHRPPDVFWLSYAIVWSISTLIVAWSIFHKAEFAFAENI
jgi:ABC-type polysaccharide/polyol phosphate export permease